MRAADRTPDTRCRSRHWTTEKSKVCGTNCVKSNAVWWWRGRLEFRRQGEAVLRVAEALGWPVLPDVSSQIRLGANSGLLVPYYDVLLSDEQFRESHVPEAVLHFGGRALSKRLEQLIAEIRPDPYVIVQENPFRLDPSHRVTCSVQTGIEGFCEGFGAGSRAKPECWLRPLETELDAGV